MEPLICCVDGNIGAGKSTALNELKRRGYVVFEEDVTDWLPLLTLFYGDQKRWSFTLQMKVLYSLCDQYSRIKKIQSPIVFVERGPRACEMFTRNSKDFEFINEHEYNLFQTYYELMNPWKPDVTFMLTTNIDECLDRISLRARMGETTIDRLYLENLEKIYSDILNEKTTIAINGHQSSVDIVDDILSKLI